ncbi:ComEA family DNA-binding protein [Hippea jasoniae]|uniref:ComEA family DNA-binding protein n=1 Tax=Hippea jasoniae TaxID=944479 RepID=UPI0005542F91|nr:helix-hairpin-helix domain-containing protein [Hippea jasoniae]
MKKLLLSFLAVIFMTALAFAKVNLNTANVNELVKLNGIGKTKAQAIVDYRKDHPFKKVEDLLNVKGIGPKILEKNKDNLCVGSDC